MNEAKAGDKPFVSDSNTGLGLMRDMINHLLPKMGEKERTYKSRLELVNDKLLEFMSSPTDAGRWLLTPNPLLRKRDGVFISPIDLVASELGTDSLLNEIIPFVKKNGDDV